MPIPGTLTNRSIDYEFKKHVNLSTQLSRWMLKPVGAWPQSRDVSRWKKFYYWMINVICYGFISLLFVPTSLYAFLEAEDQYTKMKLIGPLIFLLMVYGKYFSLIIHENDIRECVERIEWDWRNVSYQDDRNIMVANANFGKTVGLVCTFCMYSSFVFYFIAIPISSGKTTIEGENLTFIPLVLPFAKLIADTRTSPTNEIVYFVQLIGGVLIVGLTAATCNLAAMLAAHACGQMEVLTNWLKYLVDGKMDANQTVDDRIADIVNYHDQILKFLTLTDKTIQHLSFVEFLGCTVDICLVGYYVIMEWKLNDLTNALTHVIVLSSFAFNVFIFCYIGELVAEQWKKIGDTSYMIEWYRLPGKKKLCCILIIAVSNSPIKLTAGNMIELSISTFANLVKTSFAFLNVLRTTI